MSRPRASHACRECRRKKVRCDLARPACTRCAATSGATCVYDGGSASGSRDYQFVQTSFSSNQGPSTASSVQASSDQVALSTARLQTLEEKLERLTSQVQALQGRSSVESSIWAAASEPPTGSVQGSDKRIRTAESTATEALQESQAGHLLVQPGGRLRYVSHRYWAAMCEEASEIETLLRGQTRYDLVDAEKLTIPPYYGTILSAPPAWDVSRRASSKFRQASPLHMLQIPDRSRCDALFEMYISCFHPVVPLTHIPTLRKDYETFWDLHRHGSARDGIQTMPLILAVLYAGAVVCHHPSLQSSIPDADLETVATEIYEQATNALHLAHFPRVPTVATLAAYLILQGTWMREEEPLTTCSFIGVAVRVAQMLGLHRDPSHFKATVKPIPAEIQRRVWWHVFYCDVSVAMAAGLPPLIERNSWDTMMVSNLYEDKMGTLEGLQHDQRMRAGCPSTDSTQDASSLVSPMGIWLKGKFQETLLMRKLLDKAFNEESMTLDDMLSARDDLQLLRRELRERSQRIPIVTSTDSYENDAQFNMWAKVILNTLGDKNWWFLHTPLLHRSISQAWQNMVPGLQLYCCAFLERYILLSCAKDFSRFQWSWPGNHQPLHALMMVLKEVERNPTATGVEVSCTVVDQVMALCGTDGGITASDGWNMMPRPLTEGGAEAWDFIGRLRARVWTKVGLDPDVFLTREEVCAIVTEKMEVFKAQGGKLDLRTPLPENDINDPQYRSVGPPSTTLASSSVQPGSASFVSPMPSEGPREAYLGTLAFDLGGGGPTPNINWEDWDSIFNAGQQ